MIYHMYVYKLLQPKHYLQYITSMFYRDLRNNDDEMNNGLYTGFKEYILKKN